MSKKSDFKPEKRNCLLEMCRKEFTATRGYHVFCSEKCQKKADDIKRRTELQKLREEAKLMR